MITFRDKILESTQRSTTRNFHLNIIQESIYHNVVDKLKEHSSSIYYKFFNKFKNLTRDEYNTMIRMCYNWFWLDNKYINSNSKEIDLFRKLKNNFLKEGGKIPSKLYRGMTFKTKEDLLNFKKSFKEKEFLYSFKSKKSTKPDYPITSWSRDKKETEDYFANFKKIKQEKYSIMMEIDTSSLKPNTILFNIGFLLKTEEERDKFLRMVLKDEYLEQDKMLRLGTSTNISRFGANIRGALLAVVEEEYLLNRVPYSSCTFKMYHEGKEIK